MERSALGSVLRLSRWVGLAPYIRAPEYQVSRTIDICGKIFYTSIGAFVVISRFIECFFNTDNLLTTEFIQSGVRILTPFIVLIGIYTASERITRMSRSLKQLEQIDINIPRRCETSGDRKMLLVVWCYFFGILVARVIYFSIFSFVGDVLTSFVQLIRLFEYLIVNLLEMQLVAFAGRVLETLDRVNESLEILIPENSLHINKNIPRVAWENTGAFGICDHNNIENTSNVVTRDTNIASTIRRSAKCYSNICEIVRTTTKKDGYLIMLLLVSTVLLMEASWHKFVIWFSVSKNIPYYIIIVSIIRNIGRSSSLIFCTEIFHQTHVQMDRTHKIINYLKCRRCDEEEVNNELELFIRMLLLNKTTYSPLNLCTLSRSFVVQVLGCLVTYLVIILTYGHETKAPSLTFDNKTASL